MSEGAVRYVCVARLDGSELIFLWESGGSEPDRIVLDDDGNIRRFPTSEAARQSALAESVPVAAERPTRYDLEGVEAWCKSSTAPPVDCEPLLNAWNLLGDLPRGESLFSEADVRANDVYDKLFHACNLPAMTEPGEQYVPTWTAAELSALRRVLLLGLAEFRGRL